MVDIKDSVARLYVRRFVIPRALIFDKPGFVDFKISGKTTILLRQLLLPESFFINVEKKIVEQYGEIGERTMYSIGKKFGYSFAENGRFENIKDHPGEGVKDWVMIASKFVEGTYASNINQQTDVSTKTVSYELNNFVVCRKLGYDFFLATGGAAGIIAWILQDKKIEGRMYESKFRNTDHFCKVLCAPIEELNKKFEDKVYAETDLDDLNQDLFTYQSFNKEVEIQHKKSFESLLNAKIFSYANGIILYQGKERFFLMEISGMYLLEKGMKDSGMKKILFESAFEVGQKLFVEFDRNNVFAIMELLSALGWGEVLMLPKSKDKVRVLVNNFPWTKHYKDIEFDMVRGLLSGIFSTIYDTKVNFKSPKPDVLRGNLSLLFESE